MTNQEKKVQFDPKVFLATVNGVVGQFVDGLAAGCSRLAERRVRAELARQ
jgi:hypothetical protein